MTLLSVAHRFGSEMPTTGGHHMAKIDLDSLNIEELIALREPPAADAEVA